MTNHMNLITRCPSCITTFRVVEDQLRLRNGLVRCGSCHTVFNALDKIFEYKPVEHQLVNEPIGRHTPENVESPTDSLHEFHSQSTSTDQADEPALLDNTHTSASNEPTSIGSTLGAAAAPAAIAGGIAAVSAWATDNTTDVSDSTWQEAHTTSEPSISTETTAFNDNDRAILPPHDGWDSSNQSTANSGQLVHTALDQPSWAENAAENERSDTESSVLTESSTHLHEDTASLNNNALPADTIGKWTPETTYHEASPHVEGATPHPDISVTKTTETQSTSVSQSDDDFLNMNWRHAPGSHVSANSPAATHSVETEAENSLNTAAIAATATAAIAGVGNALRQEPEASANLHFVDNTSPVNTAPDSSTLATADTVVTKPRIEIKEFNNEDTAAKTDIQFINDFDRKPAKDGLLNTIMQLLCLAATISAVGLASIYWFRGTIIKELPASEPYIEMACAKIGCVNTHLSKNINNLTFINHDLRALPNTPNTFELSINIANTDTKPMELPHFRLSLLDAQDQALVRKTLRPVDYLTPEKLKQVAVTGIPPSTDTQIKMQFTADTGNVPAVNFKLESYFK